MGHSITKWTIRGVWGLVESPRGVTWQRVDMSQVNCPFLSTQLKKKSTQISRSAHNINNQFYETRTSISPI